MNTHPTTSEDDVKNVLEYLKGIKAIEVERVTPLTIANPRSLSWRVLVNQDDFLNAMQPDAWRSGWGFREYYRARAKPPLNTPLDPRQVTNSSNTENSSSNNGN